MALFVLPHGHLAEDICDNFYKMHDSKVEEDLQNAFCLTGYSEEFDSGLALIIPYFQKELDPECILSAVIENFGPAIVNGSLIVNVNDIKLNSDTIQDIGIKENVKSRYVDPAIQEDPSRYLNILSKLTFQENFDLISIEKTSGERLIENFSEEWKDSSLIAEIQNSLKIEDSRFLKIQFFVKTDSGYVPVNLDCMISPSPMCDQTGISKRQIDKFFRKGMLLPKLCGKKSSGLDIIFSVTDNTLASYMSLCEGKAHMDLYGNKEVISNLKNEGFSDIRVRNFLKKLPRFLRNFLTPDILDPDLDVLKGMFSIPDTDFPNKHKRLERGSKESKDDSVKKSPAICDIKQVLNGFCVIGNRNLKAFPMFLKIGMAYYDGRSNSSWEEFDFSLSDLKMDLKNCKIIKKSDNFISLKASDADFSIEIKGFDTNRELNVSVILLED